MREQGSYEIPPFEDASTLPDSVSSLPASRAELDWLMDLACDSITGTSPDVRARAEQLVYETRSAQEADDA